MNKKESMEFQIDTKQGKVWINYDEWLGYTAWTNLRLKKGFQTKISIEEYKAEIERLKNKNEDSK